jgi:flagellar L-ring protein precursor FlgH
VAEPEPRVLKKHDLVTIIVREESSFSSDGSTDLKKEAEFEARVDEFIRLDALFRDLQLRGGGVSDPVPSIKINGAREFRGEGGVDRTDRLTLRVTAEIVDVKPNGTVVLQARQRIRTDDEEQMFVLSGICRAADVSADNTVLSTQMFDKELTKTHQGTVRQATRRGWLSKLLDAVSPF